MMNDKYLSSVSWFFIAVVVGGAISSLTFDSIANAYVRVAVGLIGGAGLGLTSFTDRTNKFISAIIAAGFALLLLVAATLFVGFSDSAGIETWIVFVLVIAAMAWALVRSDTQ